MKKIVSCFCAALICLSGRSMYVSADGNDTPDDGTVISEYIYTDDINSYLMIYDSGSATGISEVVGNSNLVTQITTHQYLQRQNGSSWDTAFYYVYDLIRQIIRIRY
jgi:hypothetical protein